MPRHRLYKEDFKIVRESLRDVTDLADHIHLKEKELIEKLIPIDEKKFYLRYGFNSLSGFCRFGLLFSKTQTQRIVTRVRRSEPTDNFGHRSNEATQ